MEKEILKKESPDTTARRISNTFSQTKPMVEFETFHKIYRLQNYRIECEYYKGSSLSKSSLESYRYLIRCFTKGRIPKSLNTTQQSLMEYLKEISQVIQPFPVLEETTSNTALPVSRLIETGTLTDEEVEYIKSDIDNSIKQQVVQQSKAPKTKTTSIPNEVYDIICREYKNVSTKFLCVILKDNKFDYSPKVVEGIISQCRTLEVIANPDNVDACLKAIYRKYYPIEQSNKEETKSVTSTRKKMACNSQAQMLKAQEMVVSLFLEGKGLKEMQEQVNGFLKEPLSERTIEAYYYYLCKLQKNELSNHKLLPKRMVTLYEEMSSSKKVSKPAETPKQVIKTALVENISEDLYAIVDNGNVLATTNNFNNLSMLLAAYKYNNSQGENLKQYVLKEIEQ